MLLARAARDSWMTPAAGKLVLAGIAVGTLGAYAMGHALSVWLYSGDPVTLVVSVLILGGVAFIAAVGPIRRAVRVSPESRKAIPTSPLSP